jgi:DNA-directed RNA polymerase specialized sigma24 family protein
MPATTDRGTLLAAPELRSALVRFLRGRVPEADVEDVVQATLADAFAAREAPTDAEDVRRWVFGIAKNKAVDVHRKGRRELPREGVGDEASAESAPHSARALLRWAEEELPEGEGAASTLEWMLREGDGEKLEHIAEEAELPAPRVRQRVSRLRRYFRTRWAAQLAAAATLAVLGLVLWKWLESRSQPKPAPIAREVQPDDRAREIRRLALDRCQAGQWAKCVELLDQAKAIDPIGEEASAIRDARAAAARGLAPTPPPEDSPPAPSASAPPPPPAPPPTTAPPAPPLNPKLAPEKGTSLEPPPTKQESDAPQQLKAPPKAKKALPSDFGAK